MAPAVDKESHFRKIVQFDTDYAPTTVTKYESTRTGLSSVVVDRKGPKILGYFALATEIHDDSGAPHTLEHLVFMGSKNYRYKGLLDKLANRAYSHTNAWTASEQTVYTLDTAGWAGFAQILPVYLEHILLPTITDAGCYTEVHHVDGTGQDAGVVYCEMQAVQNTSDGLVELESCRQLYPEGCGYRYETGGMMEHLRVLTTDRIRKFHKEMYQPKNLCVIIIGEVDHDDLLNILEKFEESILEHFPTPMAKRPWVDSPPVPPLAKTVQKTVEFPEKDESMGLVTINYLGPDCRDPIAMAALTVLGTYLAGSSVSVLDKNLVEIEEPYASSVNFYFEERPNTVISISMSSVPTKKLAEAEQKVMELLKKTASEPLDLEYMKDCLRRSKRQVKFYLDLSGDHMRTPIITDFIYGKKDGSTLKHLQSLKGMESLEDWGDREWRDFLRKWLADAHHVSILGKPSAKLAKEIKEKEKARVAERVAKLGEKGLKELAEKLEEAKTQNDVPIPREIIDQFKVPEVDSIHFINTTTVRAGLARKEGLHDNNIQKLLDSEPISADIPLYLHFEHVPTRFVHINLVLSTSNIPVELRPLLSVFIENFFDTPVIKDGKRLEFETVVSQLEKFTVEYRIDNGYYLGAAETIRIKIQIEPEHYPLAIEWLQTLLWDVIFDKKRLQVAVSKLLQDIPEEKRSGDDMSYSVARAILSSRESIGRARDTLVKALYLKRIAKLLETDENRVIENMKRLRDAMCKLENMRVLVIADVENLKDPVATWKGFVEGRPTTGGVVKVDRRKDRVSPIGENPGNVCQIVPLHTIDSTYSLHVTKGPSSISDPHLPALILALAYLQTIEGPLWVGVRGTGLAYGASFSRNLDVGHITFTIYRAPDAYRAFDAAKAVIQSHIDGSTPFDPHLLEGALSSIVVTFAEEEANMASAAEKSYANQVVWGVGKTWNAELLKKVKEVTIDEIKKVLEDVVMGCFEPERSVAVCVASVGKVDAVKKGFETAKFKAEVSSLEKFQDSYGLEVEGVVGGEENGEANGSETGSEGEEDESDEESDED